jgi:hypothetical protein
MYTKCILWASKKSCLRKVSIQSVAPVIFLFVFLSGQKWARCPHGSITDSQSTEDFS